jgi:hypothetical protein
MCIIQLDNTLYSIEQLSLVKNLIKNKKQLFGKAFFPIMNALENFSLYEKDYQNSIFEDEGISGIHISSLKKTYRYF